MIVAIKSTFTRLIIQLRIFLIGSLFICHANCFNVDSQYPVIIRNIDGPKTSSYFGTSVKFLKADTGATWVIIGAPKANYTPPQGADTLEPGVIWQCSLGHSIEKCRAILMDSTSNMREGSTSTVERKDEGWLGGPGSVALDSSSFVACASRWEERKVAAGWPTNSSMHGICYRRPRSDLFKDPIPGPQPEKGRLTPYKNGIEFTSGNRFWQNGQAGFSTHMPKTGNEILMGAPGIEQYRGSLIRYLSRDGGETFSDIYISRPLKNKESIGLFNYLGYSLTSGYFVDLRRESLSESANLQRSLIQYAAGAPRGYSLKGKVIIFTFPEKPNDALEIQEELRGVQAGSYFGASLLALDVNGDGYDDLLVGAPRFSRESSLLKGRGMVSAEMVSRLGNFEKFGGYGDEGAVYLHLSNGYSLNREEVILQGGKRPWSQFGTAMTSLGDLNRDGYKDFAVSAPYEDSLGTTGAVYIYHGSADGIINKHAQVILASSVDRALRGFGFSLAGEVDVDDNGFNDIAIGSFNSSHTVILRSKPIITVYGKILSNVKKLPLNLVAFDIKSCVSFTGDYAPELVNLRVRLQSDKNIRPNRVHMRLVSEEAGPSNIIEYDVNVSKNGETCTNLTAMIKEPLETSGAPVVFEQSISMIDDVGSGQVKKRVVDIHRDGSSSISGEAFSAFCKKCPKINEAKRTKFELQLPLAVPCGDDDICKADLRLDVTFRDVPSTGFVIGSSSTVVMDVMLSNFHETAIAPALLISWAKLKLKRIPQDCVLETEQGILITYKCSLGKMLTENQMTNVSLEFDVSTLVVREFQMEHELLFNVSAITASEMIHKESKNIILPLMASADAHIGGSKYFNEFNMDTLSSFEVFKHIFEVGLDGPSPIGNVEIIFDIPVSFNATGAAINVRGVTADQSHGKMNCQATKGQFAKIDSVVIPSNEEMEEKDPEFDAAGIGGLLPIEKEVKRESNSSLIENNRLLIHCDSPFVACMEVTCKTAVYYPASATVISFVLDMESDTIRSLFKTYKVAAIQVESKGRIVLPEVVRKIQPEPNKPDESISITLFEREGYKPISKWIYILAVVIGIIVLLCVGCCLYACGCFEDKSERMSDREDVVDKAEENVPLQKISEDSKDASTDNDNQVRSRSPEILQTPSIDTTEPPEFIPKDPPILEETEDDVQNEESMAELE